MRSREIVPWLALLVGLAAGCAEGPKFVQLAPDGGVVAYPLKKDRDSIYASPFRAEALSMIDEHCGKQGYRIVREGETKGQTRNSGRDADELLTTRRFWGLHFRCKAGE